MSSASWESGGAPLDDFTSLLDLERRLSPPETRSRSPGREISSMDSEEAPSFDLTETSMNTDLTSTSSGDTDSSLGGRRRKNSSMSSVSSNGDEAKEVPMPKAENESDSKFTAIDPRYPRPKDPVKLTNFDKIEVLQKTRIRKTEKVGGFRVKKISPRNIDVPFNLAAYLHKDKINEIINIESLEKTLDDVLTISDDEMNRLLGCNGDALNILVTPGEDLDCLTHISATDMDRHFKQNDSVDTLLAVPGLDALTDIGDDDMKRMMHVSNEMLECEVAQCDLDNLLDINQYTNKIMMEKKVLTKMTDVPNVSKLTRVLFKDLKKMTDVKSVENLTRLDRTQVEDSVAIKWVKENKM